MNMTAFRNCVVSSFVCNIESTNSSTSKSFVSRIVFNCRLYDSKYLYNVIESL